MEDPMDFDFVASANEDRHRAVPARPPIPLTRREFLKGAGVLTGTLAATSILAALAPSRVWALELKTLSSTEGDALLQTGKVLYPHKGLPDAVYALLAKDLDDAAGKDPKTAQTLRDGVVALDKAAGGSFVNASDATKLAAVKSMEGTPFFSTVRGQCVTSLYNNEMAFAHFGYPGSSWDKGGYILRGFNDLKWLPNPPGAASPAPYKA
jgi:hypothetical protein